MCRSAQRSWDTSEKMPRSRADDEGRPVDATPRTFIDRVLCFLNDYSGPGPHGDSRGRGN